MDVAFASTELALLCNSGVLLAQRLGPQLGRTVARRLCDLAAIDARALERLPDTRVERDGGGVVQLSIADSVTVRGVLPRSGGAGADSDVFLITSLHVEGAGV